GIGERVGWGGCHQLVGYSERRHGRRRKAADRPGWELRDGLYYAQGVRWADRTAFLRARPIVVRAEDSFTWAWLWHTPSAPMRGIRGCSGPRPRPAAPRASPA